MQVWRWVLHLPHLLVPELRLRHKQTVTRMAGRAASPSAGGAPEAATMHTTPYQPEAPTAGLAELHDRFLQFLCARVGNPATAEDILQAAYVKALEHESELRAAESSVAWFYRILRNAVADHFRRTAVRSKAAEQIAAESAGSYELELEAEACTCIRAAVRAPKPAYREAIERVDLGGESVESFAQSQGTTANNAYVRVHRARKAVAGKLLQVCGICATHRCIDCTCKRDRPSATPLRALKK